MKTVYFHGSPGFLEDIDHLGLELINPSEVSGEEKVNVLAYSFGCYRSLGFLVEKIQQVQNVFWVSPFVFVDQPPSSLIKTLLTFPVVGNFLLGRMAPKAIDKFIKESSAPVDPTEDYLKVSNKLKCPQLVKESIFEKDITSDQAENRLSRLKLLEQNFHILTGSQDLKCQFQRIKNYSPHTHHKIESGGHALLWTHADQVKTLLKQGGII